LISQGILCGFGAYDHIDWAIRNKRMGYFLGALETRRLSQSGYPP
jgi:hypothetical protein